MWSMVRTVCFIACFIPLGSINFVKSLVGIMGTRADVTVWMVMAVIGNDLHSVFRTHKMRDILHWVYNMTHIFLESLTWFARGIYSSTLCFLEMQLVIWTKSMTKRGQNSHVASHMPPTRSHVPKD